MSDKQKSAKYSQSRTDTLIGAGTRIEGHITFTGVLRTEGEVIGDVSCENDPLGTIVVGKSGRVTGALKAPHIVIVGRVDGPVHSSESLEIQPSAHVVGDASYKDIVIHEGALIEGVLSSTSPPQEDRSGQEHRVHSLPNASVPPVPTPAATEAVPRQEFGSRTGKGRLVGISAVLLLAVVLIVWLRQSPTAVTPTAAEDVPPAHPAALESPAPPPPTTPLASATAPVPAPVVTASVAVPPPPSPALTKETVQTPPPASPQPVAKDVTVVQGDDAGKPSDFVYVVAGKESVVLFTKQGQDPGDGSRVELAQGNSKRIPISKDQLLRVAQGRGMQMFYQGRKLTPATIEGGAWLSFVPKLRAGAQ